MSKLADTILEATTALEAKKGEAGQAWATFEKAKVAAAEFGPELLKPEHKAEFEALEAASKAYDTVCDDVNTMQAQLNRLMEIDGSAAPLVPGSPLKGATGSAAQAEALASIGDRWSESETRRFLAERRASDPHVQFGNAPGFMAMPKEHFAALMTTTSFPSQAWRRPGIVALPQQSLSILDLINIVPTDSETVEWVYEKTFTNAAVETAEADAAGEGTLEFDDASVSCKWIPFAIPSTRQLISDEARMRPWIEERLPRGVRTRLQTQILHGDGLVNNLKGIDHWTGVLIQDAGADIPADILHKAKTKVIVQTYGNYTPNVVLLHPNDEERLVLDKDGNTNYRFGGPEVDHVRTIWGMIPVVHPAVTEGEPIVGDITQAELYVREGVSVSVTDSHSDFFTKGKLMWMASGRFGFAVLQPKAFCQCTDFDS